MFAALRHTPDGDEKATFPIAGHKLLDLSEEVVPCRSRRSALEQRSVTRLDPSVHDRWHATDELDAGVAKPVQHLADRVCRFVGMTILIGEPRSRLPVTHPHRAQVRIDPPSRSARPA